MIFGYSITKREFPSQNHLYANLAVICQHGSSFNLIFFANSTSEQSL